MGAEMGKIRTLLVCVVVLCISCVSTRISYYSNSTLSSSNKLYLALDRSATSIGAGGFGYTYNNGLTFFSALPETVRLGSIKNIEKLKSALTEKGYTLVNTEEEADVIMMWESSSHDDFSTVTLGFYDKKTNQLLFTCEGKYGLGWGFQDDLNNALTKALESVPIIN